MSSNSRSNESTRDRGPGVEDPVIIPSNDNIPGGLRQHHKFVLAHTALWWAAKSTEIMSDPSSETQPTRDASEKEGSRPSITLGEYCEQLRKWMDEVNCWQAFHQYNTVMMAYQDQLHTRRGQSDRVDGGLRRRRQEPEVDFVEQNDGGEVRRDPVLVLPVPPSARDVAVIHNPNGPDLLAAQFTVASYLRRFFAEVIDFVFAFFIKLLLVYYLVELELVDLSRFDKLLSNEADLQTLVDITQELFPLELLGKLACSLLEALCLSQSLFARFSGQTPGKYVMGVRVIECGSVTHVAGAPANVVRVTGSVLIPFKAAVLRSLLKNILINSLVPFSTVAFAFNFNRAIYDIVARTIVVLD